MRVFLALLLLVLAGPVTAQGVNCAAQWSKFSDLLITSGRLDTALPGLMRQTADGGCRTNRLVFPAGKHLTIKADSLRWSGDDLARFATDGLPPTSLRLALTGITLVPEIGDRVFSYLQGIQARGNEIDVSVSIDWDEAEKELNIKALRIDLPLGDFVEVQGTVEGIDLSTSQTIQMSAGSFAMTEATVVVRSQQMFQDFLLLPLGMPLLEGADNPAARVQDLKMMGLEFIADVPDAVLSIGSKAALKALISDMPEPSGILRLSQTSTPGIGPARAIAFAMRGGDFEALDDFLMLMQGIKIDITYDRL